MDYKNVFLGLVIAFLATTAITLFAVSLNTKYAGIATTIDTGFMDDSGASGIEDYLSTTSVEVANSTAPPSVSSGSELTQSRNTFSLIRSMVDFIPRLIRTSGSVLGIPAVYINLAVWAFIFVFGITLAYILILGVQNLIK